VEDFVCKLVFAMMFVTFSIGSVFVYFFIFKNLRNKGKKELVFCKEDDQEKIY
jgi:hypothetical protein